MGGSEEMREPLSSPQRGWPLQTLLRVPILFFPFPGGDMKYFSTIVKKTLPPFSPVVKHMALYGCFKMKG